MGSRQGEASSGGGGKKDSKLVGAPSLPLPPSEKSDLLPQNMKETKSWLDLAQSFDFGGGEASAKVIPEYPMTSEVCVPIYFCAWRIREGCVFSCAPSK